MPLGLAQCSTTAGRERRRKAIPQISLWVNLGTTEQLKQFALVVRFNQFEMIL
jgi:hypothetical protein